MGWGGATGLFDGAVDVALSFKSNNPSDWEEAEIGAVVKDMYTRVDWGDWDTQSESRYFEPYLKNVMVELGEIDPEDD